MTTLQKDNNYSKILIFTLFSFTFTKHFSKFKIMVIKFKLCIFFVVSIFLSSSVFSQTYLIPGALQQPSWVFPIFIEDAIGQKDTVYIGYDGTYGEIYTCYDDGVFNEKKYEFDSIPGAFDTFICQGFDSITNIDINNFQAKDYTLYVINANYPLKLSWDSSLLYADSLPFPSVPGLPKAEVVLYWMLIPNQPIDPNCYFNSILITDTCNAAFSCCQPDSMIFIDFLNQGVPVSTSFTLTFRPWTGQVVGLSEPTDKFLNLFPNPIFSNSFLNIQSNLIFASATLISISGKVLASFDINENKIEIPSITSGMYFLVLSDSNLNSYFQKLVIK